MAIRLAEFVVRHVADVVFGLYASTKYLEQHGPPDFAAGCSGDALMTLQQDWALLPEAKRLAEFASDASIAMRSDSRAVQVAAVRSGYGFGFLPIYVATKEKDLVELEAPGGRIARNSLARRP